LLDQPLAVANGLEDYFSRHTESVNGAHSSGHAGLVQYFTSGDPAEVSRVAELFLGQPVRFGKL
jgi:hypothetical protein